MGMGILSYRVLSHQAEAPPPASATRVVHDTLLAKPNNHMFVDLHCVIAWTEAARILQEAFATNTALTHAESRAGSSAGALQPPGAAGCGRGAAMRVARRSWLPGWLLDVRAGARLGLAAGDCTRMGDA